MKPIPFRTAADVEAALERTIAHLRSGGLLAYPTETVYGVGSRPRAPEVEALRRLKGRRPDKPFLLLVSHREMAEAHGLAFSAAASALARAFWPGPLSLVKRSRAILGPPWRRGRCWCWTGECSGTHLPRPWLTAPSRRPDWCAKAR